MNDCGCTWKKSNVVFRHVATLSALFLLLLLTSIHLQFYELFLCSIVFVRKVFCRRSKMVDDRKVARLFLNMFHFSLLFITFSKILKSPSKGLIAKKLFVMLSKTCYSSHWVFVPKSEKRWHNNRQTSEKSTNTTGKSAWKILSKIETLYLQSLIRI